MVFLFILIGIIIVTIILAFSKIKIQIINFRFNSQSQRHINRDYQVIFCFNVLKVIPILKINITKTKLEKIKKIDLTPLKENQSLDKQIWQAIKKLDIVVKNINLQINIGTENARITSILVPIISTVIAIALRKKMKDDGKQKFNVYPIYQNQNLVNLYLSGIFEIKISHIINIMYKIIKKQRKGVKKYERTSHRRPYDYGYE